MKKDNWKLIKKLVSNYGDNKKEKEPQITPVFAYRNVSPLDVNEKFIEIFNLAPAESWKKLKKKPLEKPEGEYNFFVSVIKKHINNFDYYWVKIVIDNETDDSEPIVDQKLFSVSEGLRSYKLVNYVTVPNRIFKIKNQHRDVIIFEGSPMTEKKYMEVLGVWMDHKLK
tara:strand:- start:192 stop:698 length:507 start_codon:yes stop_codon:yes gene_type:complete